MIDGSTSVGSVFLAPHSRVHGGRQTLEELLEEAAAFLPLKNAAGEFFLAGKEGLTAIRSLKGDEREMQFTSKVPIRLRIVGFGALEGALIMPEVRDYFRVSDYLNGSDSAWLRVERDDDIYWIKKASVLETSIEAS
jgi:hypothetical protein